MKTLYEVYRVGAAEPERGEIDWPKEPGYDRIKALVEPLLGKGEPLEHVSVLHKDKRCDMFVSELGHMNLTWRAPLPINREASKIYLTNWLKHHNPGVSDVMLAQIIANEVDHGDLDKIAGTAVLFTNRVVWL